MIMETENLKKKKKNEINRLLGNLKLDFSNGNLIDDIQLFFKKGKENV